MRGRRLTRRPRAEPRASSSALVSRSNSASTRARPARPSRAAKRRIVGEPPERGGDRRGVAGRDEQPADARPRPAPGCRRSRWPRPAARVLIASISTTGMPSRPPARSARSARRGRRRAAARRRPAGACAGRRAPTRSVEPGRPDPGARGASRSGPSPTRRQRDVDARPASSRQASIRWLWPLTSCSVPTQRIRSGVARGRGGCERGRREPAGIDAAVDDVTLGATRSPHSATIRRRLSCEIVATNAASATFAAACAGRCAGRSRGR